MYVTIQPCYIDSSETGGIFDTPGSAVIYTFLEDIEYHSLLFVSIHHGDWYEYFNLTRGMSCLSALNHG